MATYQSNTIYEVLPITSDNLESLNVWGYVPDSTIPQDGSVWVVWDSTHSIVSGVLYEDEFNSNYTEISNDSEKPKDN